MQTLEEKKALLQRAMDEGLRIEFRDPQFNNEEDWVEIYPIFLEDEWVVERDPTRGLEEYELKSHEFRIAKPHKTDKEWADELADAVQDLLLVAFDAMGWNWLDDDPPEPESTVYPEVIERYKQLINRYREQESK